MFEEHDLLVWRQGVPGMDRGLLRVSFENRRDLGFGNRNARIGFAPVRPSMRRGKSRFPPHCGVMARVACKDTMEHGRTGSHQPDHDQRCTDLFVEDLGMTRDPVLGVQVRLEALEDPAAQAEAPRKEVNLICPKCIT